MCTQTHTHIDPTSAYTLEKGEQKNWKHENISCSASLQCSYFHNIQANISLLSHILNLLQES